MRRPRKRIKRGEPAASRTRNSQTSFRQTRELLQLREGGHTTSRGEKNNESGSVIGFEVEVAQT